MNKGDTIKIMYIYSGQEIESDAIFLGHRNEAYMYADRFSDYCYEQKYLVKVQTPDNKEIIKELDSVMTPKEYPEVNYCDDLKDIIARRERDKRRSNFLEPIYLGKVYMNDNTLTINDKSFTAEKINGNLIFTNEQLDDIEYQLNTLVTNKEMTIEVKYNWQLCTVFRNNAKERDLYIVGNTLGIENNNINWSYDKYVEIAKVHRPDW